MKIDGLTPDKAIFNELGDRLGRIRKQQGFSQDKLAAEAGIGVATLRRIEDGKDSQLGSWIKILKALQMTTSIETLLPEAFNSPMSEALTDQKLRKRARNKVSPDDNTPSAAPPVNTVWGDENS